MAQNRRRNAQEWSEIFSDWQRSGESQHGYCRREEISISAFGYWRRKIERNDDKHPFIKVNGLASLPGGDEGGFTVRAGGVLVELTGCESEELLSKVFRALKAIS
jgi:hypothetical protein